MKILLTTPDLNIGGVQSFVCNLAVELSKKENTKVYLIVFTNSISEKYSYIYKENIEIISLNKKTGFSISFLIKLYSIIKRINPDIINSHSSRTFRYLICLPINRKYKLVHTITNNPQIYNKYLYPLYKRRMHQKSWKIKFVGISDIITKNLSEIYRYEIDKIETIYNGIYLVGLDKNKNKDIDLFTCAGLTDIKNQIYMIEAFRYIKDKKINLYIAGEGPLHDFLQQRIYDYNLESQIILLGNIENPNDFYRRSKFFILTSKSEGNPLCIIEAMSAGLPVIASNVGGIPDLICNQTNGYLFDINESPKVLAEIIIESINLPDYAYRKISEENLNKSKNWDIYTITNEYMNLYEKVAKEDYKW